MIPIPKIPTTINTKRKISGIEFLQYFVLISLVLYFGKLLFIPLFFALLISFILYPVCKWLEKKGINHAIAIVFSLTIVFFILASVLCLLILQIKEFAMEWEPFKIKLLETINQISVFISQYFNITNTEQTSFFQNILNHSENQAIDIIKSTFYSFSQTAFYIIIIPVFSALILFHRQMFAKALFHFFPSNQKEAIREILIETIHAYHDFIKGMLLVYIIVGFLNSIGLLIIGIPHPFMFGFVAAILTFIPYIGIMISALLPIAISWITYDSIWYPIGVITVFAIVQILEAYIIFPYVVGSRLKINTLVIIIMITLGGILWGAAGMILFIPFTSVIKLIADRTESLKAISILLGEGKLKEEKTK
ncbi:AI-2E family transporter [Flavobacterium undicola]|uniref:AI-2E family transporter n=1 Tax=Flavobacterium undicola TaxID=1932779 RepID=UPI001377DBC5|nr:AI-2E family transporter [Flavobacterium undicola]MBA0885239.1 AI-2E family transporter [Flavobacterium undicola]